MTRVWKSVGLLVLTFALTFALPTTAVSRSDAADTSSALPMDDMVDMDEIDSIFAEWNEPGAPGGAVAVIRDGSVIFSKGYGLAQLEYDVPVTPTTVFHVASVSKQFTAMSAVLLAHDGAIGLDDDVQTHLPWVNQFEHPVTIRHLLNHTSGIRDQWELLGLAGWRLDDVITMDDIRGLMKRQVDLNFEPQTEFMYSNMGYTLLADVVATTSKTPFRDFAEARIFQPLGMTRTHFHDDHQEIVPNRAYSYAQTENGWQKSVLSFANAGATSLFTTAEDLLSWLDNFRVLDVGNERVMADMVVIPRLKDSEDTDAPQSGYASGLGVNDYKGLVRYGHGGADAGFRSGVAWFPAQNVGIAVLSNFASSAPTTKLDRVADVVLGLPRNEASAAPDATASDFSLDPDQAERLTGSFRFESGFAVTIRLEDESLVAEPGGLLTPVSATGLRLPAFDVQFDFDIDGEVVQAVSLTQNGDTTEGTPIVEELIDENQASTIGGHYYSPELGRVVEMAVRDGKLMMRHPRAGDLEFTKQRGTQEYWGGTWFAQKIVLNNGADGSTEGMLVSGARNRNHRFTKVQL